MIPQMRVGKYTNWQQRGLLIVVFVATQDYALADLLRAWTYVPLLQLVRAVLLLESPSSASRSYTGTIEQSKFTSVGGTVTAKERQVVGARNVRWLAQSKRKDPLKRRYTRREEHKILQKQSRDELGGAFSNRREKDRIH
jgi:hypothetical protein